MCAVPTGRPRCFPCRRPQPETPRPAVAGLTTCSKPPPPSVREVYDMSNPPTILPPNKMPALRIVPMPADLNAYGAVFGGWVMAQVDIAGAIPALKRARGRVAPVAVNCFQFKQAVSVGDVVSFYVEIIKVGRTSVTVDVEVFAERHPENPIVVKVTEAQLTYVAVDAEGNKRELPPE